jgi:hypothetical protein
MGEALIGICAQSGFAVIFEFVAVNATDFFLKPEKAYPHGGGTIRGA